MLKTLRAAAMAWTVLVFPAVVFSQAQPNMTFSPVVKGLVLQDVECSEFHSKFTGHDYHVYVSLPASYLQGDRRYPVLYVPDHEIAFLAMNINKDILTSPPAAVEEFILVGVPLKSETPADWSRERTFDFTPTEVKARNKSLSQRLGGEVHTGGAPMFLRTLKEELIPYIESKYRANSDRGLAGYSDGGLFAAYVWLNDSNTFSRYLVGSSGDWDNGVLLKTEAALAKSGKTLHGRVFISVGSDEEDEDVRAFKNLTTAITSHAYPNLRMETHVFESTDHRSGGVGAFFSGLKFLYALPKASR
jgi:predicted alpha/beta superfamily hydrolase